MKKYNFFEFLKEVRSRSSAYFPQRDISFNELDALVKGFFAAADLEQLKTQHGLDNYHFVYWLVGVMEFNVPMNYTVYFKIKSLELSDKESADLLFELYEKFNQEKPIITQIEISPTEWKVTSIPGKYEDRIENNYLITKLEKVEFQNSSITYFRGFSKENELVYEMYRRPQYVDEIYKYFGVEN